MVPNYIEFKKKREIGDVLGDTFKFLRQNYRQLFGLILKIAGPAFLLLLAALAFYVYSFRGMLNPLAMQEGVDMLNIGGSFISVFVMLFAFMVFYSFQLGTVLFYIKSYIQNNGIVDESAVKDGVKTRFASLIGLGFLSVLIIMSGAAFCVLPGIYLYVPMSITFAILVFQNNDVSDAISNSFKLVKDEWWSTFLTLFVLGLIIGVVSSVFQLPLILYSFIKGFSIATEGSVTDPSEMVDAIFIFLNVLSSAIQYILYTISIIGIAFIYFNLNERKNFTGTFEQIDSLGKTE